MAHVPTARRTVIVALSVGLLASACSSTAQTKGSDGGGSKLTVTYMDSGTYNKAAQALVPEFDKAEGATVDVQAFPFATLGQKNATDLISGTGSYDVLSTSAWDVAIYNKLAPLEDKVASWPVKGELIDHLLTDGPAPFSDGKIVGVPYAADAYGVFVNTKYLPADTKFSTWDDLVSAATTLKGKLPSDVAPISFAFGAAEQTPALFQGAYTSYYINTSTKWALDPAPAAKALDTVKAVEALGPKNAAALTIDQSNQLFLSGKAAILIGWPSFVRGALNDAKQSTLGSDWALTPFPGPGTPALSSWTLSLSSLSKNKELGWKWVDSFITPEHSKEWMFTYGIGSPFKSTYTDPALLKEHANDLPVQMDNLGRATPLPLTLQSFEAFYRPMGDFTSGNGDSAATVAKINQAWSRLEVPAAIVPTAKNNGFVQK